MKVYVNRFPINGPWGGGNQFVRAFHDEAPEMGAEIQQPNMIQGAPDVIILAGLDNDGLGISAEEAIIYKMYQDRVKLVLRVNENDARKNTSHMDEMLLKLAPHMDGIVFVSRWLQDYFQERGWPSVKSTVVINGVDRDVFLPQPKLNNGKVNIVAHHWSDNYLKGFDIYDQLDEFVGQNSDKFSFTYIGRDRNTFKHTKVIRPMVGKRLGQELGKYDLYISASRFDPGPNHITESISCGLPTYVHVEGGGCVEFAGSDHVYRDWEELRKILVNGRFESNSTRFSTWTDCVNQYIKFLEEIIKQ